MPDPERPASFSLFAATRIVARGGGLDAKLAALADQARALPGVREMAVLIEAEAGIVSSDGQVLVPVNGEEEALRRARNDRRSVSLAVSDGAALAPLLGGAGPALLVPLVVNDDLGDEVEGVLAVARTADATEDFEETVEALADLVAIAVRHARLQNTLWEQSDYADRLAHTDRLTGLANRVTFERMLELEIARATRHGSPLGVALLAIDGLAALGQAQGGAATDRVVRAVAATIADSVRLLDTVARVGDDEFAVIAPGDAGGAIAVRLRDAIGSMAPAGEIRASVSGAVVHHPDDGATGAELLASARSGLGRAKQAGPGAILGPREPAA